MKQLFPNRKNIIPYALLGYGNTSYIDEEYSSLAWGIGAEHSYNGNLNFFIDYISYYSDDFDVSSFILGTYYVF